jgi:hypothetical protein
MVIDLKRFATKPREKAEVAAEAQPNKARRQQQAFTIVPDVWKQRLLKAKYLATYRLALHILGRNFETHGKPFSLLNVTLEGVSRWQKWRALLELEELGLIIIERRQRKAPWITALHKGRKPT